jgi:protein-tyrosine phosphatase
MTNTRVDIHFHLLPGIDDGAATIEETIELARAAEADGTGVIVATPHVRNEFVTDVSDLPDRVAEVRDELAREGIDVHVCCGAELGHDMVARLGQGELETVAVGPPGARWVLLEAPFEGSDDELHTAADELRDRGFAAVLAHPERSPVLMAEGAAALRRELVAGSLLQVTTWSLAGGHGSQAEDNAVCLLEAGLVTCLATDAHPGWRGPVLTVGLDKASSLVGLARARPLTDSAPRALLERGAQVAVPA